MAIQFDYDSVAKQAKTPLDLGVARFARDVAELKPADPKLPPPSAPALNMRPRRHDVVRWSHDGYVTQTSHETKEAAIEYAHALHWATTWKWTVMCGRELIERRELQEPAGYDEQVRKFFMSRNGIA